jgi:P pilus assembly chaperone PapD
MRRILPALLLVLAPAASHAQGVLVAPHVVFIDPRTRSGWVQLHNPGSDPAEVTIETLFGYPVTDSLGNLQLRTVDKPDSAYPSAAGWIQIFPRRVLVPAQTRQTIRLMMLPPPGTADGEYWARLAISAKAGRIPVAGVDTGSGISVGLSLEVRTIIPLIYRKGQTSTGVTVSDLRATADSDSIHVRVKLARKGNAAFLGSVRGTLLNQGGTKVGSFDIPISVYYDIDPRFTIARRGLPAGSYRLLLEVSSARDDIAPEQILPITAVRNSLAIQLR